MDQDMRKWIEQQRQLAREGKLPKERLDVLALVDIPFGRNCRPREGEEEKGMNEDYNEEDDEDDDEEEDPDYDSESSDEDRESFESLESSYSAESVETDSDDEDNGADWREDALASSLQAQSSRRYGLRQRLFGNSNATSTKRTTTNATATVGAKRRWNDDAARTCLPRPLQGASRRSHSASSSPLKKWRASSPDSADDIKPVHGLHRDERDCKRGRRAPTERDESGTASVEESLPLIAASAAVGDAHAEEEFSSASDGEAADGGDDPLEEMSTLVAKAMYLDSILDWI